MARTVVGVLRGGTSSEYDLSLKSGAHILATLPEETYDTRDILIDKQGVWYVRGMPVDPARALAQVDVVLNALHGGVGEDGSVQRLLQRSGVRYFGARPLAAAQSLNKIRAHDVFRNAGLSVLQTVSFTLPNPLNTTDMARQVFAKFGAPYIVKPANDGAGHGIRIARTILELPDVLGDVLDAYGAALVQEYVTGNDASVSVLEGFRGQSLYVFPPAHTITPEGSTHLSPEHYEQSLARHIVPSHFDSAVKRALEDAARTAHRALGMSHFSRADFIVARGKPYILEVNANPGLYPGAVLPHMLEAVGSSTREFLEHAIALA